MDCAAVKPKMEALVRGTLPDAERALAEQHIGVCEGCRLELELVRAIGSQEKPGAVGQADWTLDRIFGAEQQTGTRSAPGATGPDAAPQETASGSGAAPLDESTSAGEDRAETPSGGAGPDDAAADADDVVGRDPSSWAFEPADAKADRKPPEESLFFAQEALARRRGAARKKGSNLRVLLWGVGGLVGAILLAITSWVVLHMSPNDADSPPSSSTTSQDSTALAPDQSPAEQPPDAFVAPEPPPPAPTQETPEPTLPDPGMVSSDRDGAAALRAPQQKTSASSVPQPLPLPRPGIASSSRVTAPTVTKHAPTPPSKQVSDARPGSTTPRVAETVAPPSASPPAAPIEREEQSAESIDDSAPEPEVSTEGSGRAPEDEGAAAHPPPATSWLAPGSPRPGSSDSASPRTSPAPPSTKAPEESGPAPPKVLRPIDKIRLATTTAEEEGDLVALRRLRATWKGFISKMGVGPDRARARRDYADCLWAIQSLTGRRSDQKDALAAYREYLLSAPAGGADSRSVSRLRQLEDALSEKR